MTDTKLKFGEMLFEWDEEKNQSNIEKHGIDFSKILKIFADENRIEFFDEFHSDEEDRWQVIGKVDKILFVVYTERGDVTRIISARKATARERRIYNDSKKNY